MSTSKDGVDESGRVGHTFNAGGGVDEDDHNGGPTPYLLPRPRMADFAVERHTALRSFVNAPA